MKLTIAQLEEMKDFVMSMLDKQGRQFSYALEKNIYKIDSAANKEKHAMEDLPCFNLHGNKPAIKAFNTYVKGLNELYKKFAEKDKSTYSGYKIDDMRNICILEEHAEEYKKEKEELDLISSKGKKLLKDREAAYHTYRHTEVEVDFYKIMKEEFLPENITTRERMKLGFMLDDSLLPLEDMDNKKVLVPKVQRVIPTVQKKERC